MTVEFSMADDGEFSTRDSYALIWLAQQERFAGRPLGPRDAVLLEPGEEPTVWERRELIEHLVKAMALDALSTGEEERALQSRPAVFSSGSKSQSTSPPHQSFGIAREVANHVVSHDGIFPNYSTRGAR